MTSTVGDEESHTTKPEVAMPAIALSSVAVQLRGQRIIDDVTFDVPHRQVTGVIGPSASGKSVLLRAICGLLNSGRLIDLPWKVTGTITISGNEVLGVRAKVARGIRRNVVYVAQAPTRIGMTVYDAIALPVMLSGKVRRRERANVSVEEAFRAVGVWDLLKDNLRRPLASLSPGQIKLINVAAGLAMEPTVLILDEPTAFVDPRSTGRVEEMIDTVRGSTTVLLVTHSLHQAARVTDYAVYLEQGRVVEVGATARVFTNPTAPETEDYLVGRRG